MSKDDKHIIVYLPKDLAERFKNELYYPHGIVNSETRKRTSNCRYLLFTAIDQHVDRKTLALKEPINFRVSNSDDNLMQDTEKVRVCFLITKEMNDLLEHLKKYYMISRKALATLLICQEAERQNEDRKGKVKIT